MGMEGSKDEEEGLQGLQGSWRKEMDGTSARERQHVDDEERAVLVKLRKSGVCRNIEASRAILRAPTEGCVATDKTASDN